MGVHQPGPPHPVRTGDRSRAGTRHTGTSPDPPSGYAVRRCPQGDGSPARVVPCHSGIVPFRQEPRKQIQVRHIPLPRKHDHRYHRGHDPELRVPRHSDTHGRCHGYGCNRQSGGTRDETAHRNGVQPRHRDRRRKLPLHPLLGSRCRTRHEVRSIRVHPQGRG